jgi:hypothetical protein
LHGSFGFAAGSGSLCVVFPLAVGWLCSVDVDDCSGFGCVFLIFGIFGMLIVICAEAGIASTPKTANTPIPFKTFGRMFFIASNVLLRFLTAHSAA